MVAAAAADGCGRSESWWEGNVEFEMRRPLYGMCLWVGDGEREREGVTVLGGRIREGRREKLFLLCEEMFHI